MFDILLWLYLINGVLLIDHEIDSAYWREWELFRLPGGISGFLVLHVPLLFVVLWGLILVAERSWWVLSSPCCSVGAVFLRLSHTPIS